MPLLQVNALLLERHPCRDHSKVEAGMPLLQLETRE